jgi:hypothetical protein
MSKPRFLWDEHVDPAIIAAMQQLAPGIDVILVGDPGAPPRQTPDPDLLIAGEALGRVLVSKDKKSMPRHLINHFASGRHTAGVILLREGFSIGRYAQEIVNQWATTTADEWVDRTIYLP